MHTFVDAIYWLALSTWFGTVLLSVIAPPVILRTIREADPTLPRVLSVNLDQQHSVLLASQVIIELLHVLLRLQGICALVFLPALVGKWLISDLHALRIMVPIFVSALYLVAVGFHVYAWRVVVPRVVRHRAQYIENADNPDVANAELDQFDKYSAEVSGVVRNLLFVLLGMLLFSSAIVPRLAV